MKGNVMYSDMITPYEKKCLIRPRQKATFHANKDTKTGRTSKTNVTKKKKTIRNVHGKKNKK